MNPESKVNSTELWEGLIWIRDEERGNGYYSHIEEDN